MGDRVKRLEDRVKGRIETEMADRARARHAPTDWADGIGTKRFFE